VTGDAMVVLGAEAILSTRLVLRNVHPEDRCAGRPCVIHNRSDHPMRGWPLLWRDDRGIFERVCPHHVGHPDPDQLGYWRETGQTAQGVHGCDGCCVR
jgi:hypothetical protein